MSSLLTHLFPTPKYLRIGVLGLDLSDATLRLVELEQKNIGLVPKRALAVPIPEGAMRGGRVVDQAVFTNFLKDVRKKNNISFARVSIPEPQIYSFTLRLDSEAGKDIRSAIELVLEENIPLKAVETVFDFEVLEQTGQGIYVQVVAMADVTTSLLFQCFSDAGILPTSFELEGQAIARAILPKNTEGSAMIIDLGASRTGISIVAKGSVVFSSTLDFGGSQLTDVLAKGLNVSLEEAEKLKREFGLSSSGRKDIFEMMANALSVLKDEINRRYIYWHEKRQFPELLPNVDTIYLTGGHSNLLGLVDYLSAALKIKVVQANPWAHCFSFEKYIPLLGREEAMSYTTAIGLALVDYDND